MIIKQIEINAYLKTKISIITSIITQYCDDYFTNVTYKSAHSSTYNRNSGINKVNL